METIKHLYFDPKEVHRKEFENCLISHCGFTTLCGYEFSNCTFEHCDLSNLTTTNCLMDNMRFVECKLLGLDWSTLQSKVLKANFDHCLLNYSNFDNVRMPNTTFTHCSMQACSFVGSNLEGSSFIQSNLSGTLFESTNLKKVDLSQAYHFIIDPDKNLMSKACIMSHDLECLLTKHGLTVLPS